MAKTTKQAEYATRRAVIVARVSSDDQAEHGYGLPSQLESCRKYAQLNGFAVVAEFQDDITGMSMFADRPGGKQAQAMLDRKQADCVIVHTVDRLSRDIVGLLQTVRDWLRAGIEVHACDIGKVKSELDIVLVINGWKAGEDRRTIIERTDRGRRTKAKSNKVICCGYSPYGYTFNEQQDNFVILGHEAQIVKSVFEWYVYGNSDGKPMSAWKIAHKLSEMRIPTPGERKGRPRKRESGMWMELAVMRLIEKEVYAGVWHYDDTRVDVPAIVSRELWEAAQERRGYNKRMSKRNTKREYLLRGRVRCVCGHTMHPAIVGKAKYQYWYYKCRYVNKLFNDLEAGGCKQTPVRVEKLENLAWAFVLDVMGGDPETFKRRLLLAQEREREAQKPKRDRLAMVNDLLAKCESDAGDIARSIVRARGVVNAMLEKQSDDINAQHTALVAERDGLIAELEKDALTDKQIEDTLRFQAHVILGLKNPTFEDKLMAVEVLDVRAVVGNGKAKLDCKLPIPDGVQTEFDLLSTH